MNQYRIVIAVLVVCVSSIICQGTCPNGIQSTKLDCTGKEQCPSGSICYRKNNTRFCCGQLDTFCPTKMLAFNSEKSSSYLWGPSASTVKEEWYNVVLGSEVIACPIPFSYTYSNYMLTVLPVDFDANSAETSKPKACHLNSDCNTDKDEFCGAAFHPALPKAGDKSGKDGTPLNFCYKSQSFGSTNSKPVIITDKKELTGCDDNSDCLPFKGSETFCYTEKGKTIRIAENNGAINDKYGFCAYKQTKSRAIWWYVLAASIVCAVIFLGLSIAFYILHRKSVLKAKEAGPMTYDPDAPKTASKEKMITSSSGL